MARSVNLEQRVRALAPWHFDYQLDDVRTGDYAEGLPVVPDPGVSMQQSLLALYPEGLAGRSVLDVACNAGAYLFGAKLAGAGRCLGFDARERWIEQARLVAEYRQVDVEFQVMNLYDLEPGEWDVVLFNGIFYHLPDPITGLKIAADQCKETLIMNTAIRNGWSDGALVAASEDVSDPIQGLYGPGFYPTGPKALEHIFDWLGFTKVVVQWLEEEDEYQPEGFGRMQLAATRN